MPKLSAAQKKVVRDSRTGRFIEVRGFGALKGQLTIAKGVDLTKPIYEQVVKPLSAGSKAP